MATRNRRPHAGPAMATRNRLLGGRLAMATQARGAEMDTWRQLLKELAQADAPQVVQEARAGARARARAVLEDALMEELLSAAARAAPEGEADQPDRSPPPAPAPEHGEAFWVYGVVPADGAAGVASGLEGIEPGSSVEAL